MICYEFKGGTGTSSRRVGIGDRTYTVAALVQANHGIRPWLTILGRPVGRLMPEGAFYPAETGSIIVILATDAPLGPVLAPSRPAGRHRHRPRRHAGGNNSGDIFLAFSTANDGPMPQFGAAVLSRQELNSERIDPLYLAAVEAVEEAVVNALVAGEDAPTVKTESLTCRAIDTARLTALFR